MSIMPQMVVCEVCGGVFPVDTFAFHDCEETKKKIKEEKERIAEYFGKEPE